jgi:hypothetical protein
MKQTPLSDLGAGAGVRVVVVVGDERCERGDEDSDEMNEMR